MNKTSLFQLVFVIGFIVSHAMLISADELEFQEILGGAVIAVEVQNGQAAPNNFAGVVGSLRVDFTEGVINIIQIEDPNFLKLALNQCWIQEAQYYGTSMDFECRDKLGLAWRGKIHFSREIDRIFEVEMIRRDLPRKIINLSDKGKAFIEKHKLNRLNLADRPTKFNGKARH